MTWARKLRLRFKPMLQLSLIFTLSPVTHFLSSSVFFLSPLVFQLFTWIGTFGFSYTPKAQLQTQLYENYIYKCTIAVHSLVEPCISFESFFRPSFTKEFEGSWTEVTSYHRSSKSQSVCVCVRLLLRGHKFSAKREWERKMRMTRMLRVHDISIALGHK